MLRALPIRRTIWAVALLCVATTAASDFELGRSTMDGGGIINSTGGAYALSGTIGQPDAGIMTGGGFELSGGFWFPLAQGDCDESGNVSLVDFTEFAACLTGPAQSITPGCACFDLDHDDDADLTDLALFQSAFTGP